ncbi:unnamed protein product [Leptosia nina]|uniref:Uncharacterized protein n=1 Tax=Leptosia nina TaxID=320188 RepID=A0AAV1J5N4_9NEOP
MVGKGEVKSSRIFHQCYVKCCKLQNLTPLTTVIPVGNGKVLDFCVDRIKYADWPPILNALSCDLSLHSVAIKCRQQVKTVLEHIDCERLAKTVNKRAVILTNFMLSNLVEATSQLLSNTTLLTSLLLEGLPLKIPYLNPICEALLANNSLQHLYLPRCLIGDAGCLAICKAVRCLPNILTLDLSGCELTPLGASYIADLIKYQKIHRYSENWVHTLRYRLPELDTMAGLRRITVNGNPLGDQGVGKLLDVLADDLWIKALDVQSCGLSDDCAAMALQIMSSNTTLVVLDMRHNSISSEFLSKLRNGIIIKDRVASNVRTAPNKYATKTSVVKKEKDYAEALEEQLQEEISHRQQLEELNLQLVEQMKQMKRQQMQLWANNSASSGSEQSFQASSHSGDLSSSTESTSSVPIDQNTLSYIQQAFKDIYAFIKNNQCNGQCEENMKKKEPDLPSLVESPVSERGEATATELRINIAPKRAQSSHLKVFENISRNKTTKSAHLLSDPQYRDTIEMKPEMFERQMGDTMNAYESKKKILDENIIQNKKTMYDSSPSSSAMSDSSDTLVCSPRRPNGLNPRDALYSSSDDDC